MLRVSLRLRWNDIWLLDVVLLESVPWLQDKESLPDTGTAGSTSWSCLIISIVQPCVGMSAIFFAEFCLTLPIGWWCLWLSLCCLGVACLDGWLTMIVFMNAVSSVALVGCLPQGLLALGVSCLKPSVDLSIPVKGTYIDLLPVLVFGLGDILLMNSKQALRLNSLLVVLKFSALAVFVLVGSSFESSNFWADFTIWFWTNLWRKDRNYGRILPSCSLVSLVSSLSLWQ